MTVHDMMLGDWVRLVNILLALYALVRGAARVRRVWARVTAEARLLRLSLVVCMFTIVVGSSEQALVEIPPGLRTYVALIAVTFASVAVSLPKSYQQHPSTPPEGAGRHT